jgi:hypothetical protein
MTTGHPAVRETPDDGRPVANTRRLKVALSDQLAKLAARTKEAETRAAEAHDKARADLEQEVSSARATAKADAESLRQAVDESEAKTETWWAGVQKSWDEHVATAREKLESKKAALDARTAKARADDAEAYASYAIDLAYSTVVEAEYAVLDADLARMEADELS